MDENQNTPMPEGTEEEKKMEEGAEMPAPEGEAAPASGEGQVM
jgi:hypothetical protein